MTLKPSTVVAAAAAATLLFAAGTACASNQAGATYRVQATVPVACWVRPAGPVVAENNAQGAVVEACNSPGGFTVSASYRALAPGETARLRYAGRRLDLAAGGQAILQRSGMAAIRTVDYQFEDVALEAPLVLALTIQPL